MHKYLSNLALTLVFIFLVSLIFIQGQKETKKERTDLQDIHVNISEDNGAYDLKGDVTDFSIVKLETTKACLLDRIKKICYKNDQYYILDNKGEAIYIFSKEGHFLSKLYNRGYAPNQYVRINSFVVTDDGSIWINDEISGRLIGYNKQFEPVFYHEERIFSSDMILIDNMIYHGTNWRFSLDGNYQLVSINLQTKEKGHYIPCEQMNPEMGLVGKMRQFASMGDSSALFMYSYDNKLYEIKGNEVKPKYRYIFSDRYEDIPLTHQELMNNPEEKIRGIQAISQTEKSVLIHYADGTKFVLAIYNKKDGSCKVFPTLMTHSELGNLFISVPTITPDQHIIEVYYPSTILEYPEYFCDFNKIKDAEYRKTVEKIVSSVGSEDNPVIVKLKIKNDSSF